MIDKTPLPVVVMASGSGTNLQVLIDQQNILGIKIVAVASNCDGAYALVRAKIAGIPTHLHSNTRYGQDSEKIDLHLIASIEQYKPRLVILAGYMRILSSVFTKFYTERLINIHPSLLPKFKGLNTHQRALDAGEIEHGVTVHFVSEEVDSGLSIIQARTTIKNYDTAKTLANRIHELEYLIYPKAIKWFAEGRLKLLANNLLLDDKILPVTGYDFSHTSEVVAQ